MNLRWRIILFSISSPRLTYAPDPVIQTRMGAAKTDIQFKFQRAKKFHRPERQDTLKGELLKAEDDRFSFSTSDREVAEERGKRQQEARNLEGGKL